MKKYNFIFKRAFSVCLAMALTLTGILTVTTVQHAAGEASAATFTMQDATIDVTAPAYAYANGLASVGAGTAIYDEGTGVTSWYTGNATNTYYPQMILDTSLGSLPLKTYLPSYAANTNVKSTTLSTFNSNLATAYASGAVKTAFTNFAKNSTLLTGKETTRIPTATNVNNVHKKTSTTGWMYGTASASGLDFSQSATISYTKTLSEYAGKERDNWVNTPEGDLINAKVCASVLGDETVSETYSNTSAYRVATSNTGNGNISFSIPGVSNKAVSNSVRVTIPYTTASAPLSKSYTKYAGQSTYDYGDWRDVSSANGNFYSDIIQGYAYYLGNCSFSTVAAALSAGIITSSTATVSVPMYVTTLNTTPTAGTFTSSVEEYDLNAKLVGTPIWYTTAYAMNENDDLSGKVLVPHTAPTQEKTRYVYYYAADNKINTTIHHRYITDAKINKEYSIVYSNADLTTSTFLDSTGAERGGFKKYLSVVLWDKDGKIAYQGRLGELTSTKGSMKVVFPTGLKSGCEYTLGVFEETCYLGTNISTCSAPSLSKITFNDEYIERIDVAVKKTATYDQILSDKGMFDVTAVSSYGIETEITNFYFMSTEDYNALTSEYRENEERLAEADGVNHIETPTIPSSPDGETMEVTIIYFDDGIPITTTCDILIKKEAAISGSGGLSDWVTDTQNGIIWNYQLDKDMNVVNLYTTDNVDNIVNEEGILEVPATIGKLKYPVKSIGGGTKATTFIPQGYNGFNGISFPASLTTINDYAFYKAKAAMSVTIPKQVQSIGYGAFYAAPYLKAVTIQGATITIGEGAFNLCQNLQSVLIANSDAVIEKNAFSYNTSLLSFVVTGNRVTIGEYALIGDTALTQVSLFGEVNVEDAAFKDCSKLTGLKVDQMTGNIGAHAFENCTSLAKVYLPNTVTASAYAFNNCSGLTDVEVDMATLGSNVFASCPNITKVILDKNVQAVAYNWGAYAEAASEGNIATSGSTPSSNEKNTSRDFYIFNRNTVFQFYQDANGNYYSAFGFARDNSATLANHNYYYVTNVYYTTSDDMTSFESEAQQERTAAAASYTVNGDGSAMLLACAEDMATIMDYGIAYGTATGEEEQPKLQATDAGYMLNAHQAGKIATPRDASDSKQIYEAFLEQDYSTPTAQIGIGATYNPSEIKEGDTINKENFQVYPVYNDGTPYNAVYTTGDFYIVDAETYRDMIVELHDALYKEDSSELNDNAEAIFKERLGDDTTIRTITLDEEQTSAVQSVIVVAFVTTEGEQGSPVLSLYTTQVAIAVSKTISDYNSLVNEYGSIEAITKKIEELKQAAAAADAKIAEADQKTADAEAKAKDAEAKVEAAQKQLLEIQKALDATITDDGKPDIEGGTATDKVENCDKQLAELEAYIKAQQERIEALQAILSDPNASEQEKEEAQAGIKEAQDNIQIAEAQKDVIEAEKDAYAIAAEVEALKVQNQELADAVAACKTEYIRIVTAANELLGKDAASFDSEAEYEDYVAKSSDIMTALKELMTTLSDLEARYQGLTEQLEATFAEFLQFLGDYKAEEGADDYYQTTYLNLLAEIKKLMETYRQASEEYDAVLKHFYDGKSWEELNMTSQQVIDSLEANMGAADEQLREIQKALEGADYVDGEALKTLTSLVGAITDIKNDLTNKEDILSSLRELLALADSAGKDDYKTAITNLQTLVSTYQKDAEEWEHKYEALEALCLNKGITEDEISQAITGNSSGSSGNAGSTTGDYDSGYAAGYQAGLSASGNQQAAVFALSQQLTATQTQNATLTKENKTLSSTNSTLSKENESLTTKNESLTTENEQMSAAIDEIYQELDSALTLSSLKNGVSSDLTRKIRVIKSGINTLTEQNSTLASKNVSLQTNVEKYKTQYNTYKKKYDTCKKQYDALKSANTTLAGTNTSLKSQISSLQNQVNGLKASAGSSAGSTQTAQSNGTSATTNVTRKASYTVTFKDYDNTTIEVKQYESGERIVYPDDPEREGYTFTGWSQNPSTAIMDYTLTAQYQEEVLTEVIDVVIEKKETQILKDPREEAQAAISSSQVVLNQEKTQAGDISNVEEDEEHASDSQSVIKLIVLAVIALAAVGFIVISRKQKKSAKMTEEE